MRLLIFFDLPVTSKNERAEATKFRNTLLKEGFYMMQFSVYTRMCVNIENAKEHENIIKHHLPQSGNIRSMIVTERQFANINLLIGKKPKKDKKVDENQLRFF